MGHIIILGEGFNDREYITRSDGTIEELGAPDEMSIMLPDGGKIDIDPGNRLEAEPITETPIGVSSFRLLAQKARNIFSKN